MIELIENTALFDGDNKEQSCVTALTYNLQGDLYVGTYKGSASLLKWDNQTLQGVEIKIPVLTKDAVAYFAQNPSNENEYVFASFNKNVYLSSDQGQTWSLIAEAGTAKSHDHNEEDHSH